MFRHVYDFLSWLPALLKIGAPRRPYNELCRIFIAARFELGNLLLRHATTRLPQIVQRRESASPVFLCDIANCANCNICWMRQCLKRIRTCGILFGFCGFTQISILNSWDYKDSLDYLGFFIISIVNQFH